MRIAFCIHEELRYNEDEEEDEYAKSQDPNQKDYNDMFKAYLEQEHAENMFKICTPTQIIIFRCSDSDQKDEFCQAIDQFLRPFLGESLYLEKQLATEVNSLPLPFALSPHSE